MSNSTMLTPADVIALREKYPLGSWFTIDVNKARESTNNPCTFIPFTCLNKSGTPTRLSLKINKQIVAMNAKPPSKKKDDKKSDKNNDDAKEVFVGFKKFTENDLSKTIYPEEKLESILESNDELVKALDIIADEYEFHAKALANATKGKIKVKNKTINSFRQDKRKASKEEKAEDQHRADEEKMLDEDDKIKLPVALFRFKLKADPVTKKIGRVTKNGFEYTVFDIRQSTKANGYKRVPAKVNYKGKPTDLNVINVKHFITIFSLIGGIIDFESVIVSSQGVSMGQQFRECMVSPHPPVEKEKLKEDDIQDMADFNPNGYNDDIVIGDDDEGSDEDEPKPAKSKSAKKKKISDDEDEEDDPKPAKSKSAKPDKKKKAKDVDDNQSDEEPEDNQSDEEPEEKKKPVVKNKKPAKVTEPDLDDEELIDE